MCLIRTTFVRHKASPKDVSWRGIGGRPVIAAHDVLKVFSWNVLQWRHSRHHPSAPRSHLPWSNLSKRIPEACSVNVALPYLINLWWISPWHLDESHFKGILFFRSEINDCFASQIDRGSVGWTGEVVVFSQLFTVVAGWPSERW